MLRMGSTRTQPVVTIMTPEITTPTEPMRVCDHVEEGALHVQAVPGRPVEDKGRSDVDHQTDGPHYQHKDALNMRGVLEDAVVGLEEYVSGDKP